MSVAEGTRETLAAKFEAIFPHLDERQRRLLMGAEARVLGHGGIRVVALAAGIREATVSLGVGELDSGAGPLGRARKPGGGRKRLADLDPGLRPALLALVEPDERGDPMSPLRWTTKSLRALAAVLTRQGHRAGAETVADLPHTQHHRASRSRPRPNQRVNNRQSLSCIEPGTPDKPQARRAAGRPRPIHPGKLLVQESKRKRSTRMGRWIEALRPINGRWSSSNRS